MSEQGQQKCQCFTTASFCNTNYISTCNSKDTENSKLWNSHSKFKLEQTEITEITKQIPDIIAGMVCV